MRHTYVALIAMATVFSMDETKKLYNSLLLYTMKYPTCHLCFIDIHTCLKACVYTEKIQLIVRYSVVQYIT